MPFNFGPEQKQAFSALKAAKATTFACFDKEAPTQVIADASPVELGAVLEQNQKGIEVPVCYASRSLTDCERRYSQTEREALGLVWACERLHPYLYGQQFDLFTDDKPLEVIYGLQTMCTDRAVGSSPAAVPFQSSTHSMEELHC